MRALLIIIFSFLLFSCSNTPKKEQENTDNTLLTTDNYKISNSIGEVLSLESKKLVANWIEYKETEEALSKYYNITTKDATFKAHDLAKITQRFKDSIRVEKLDKPDVKIRLNVLHNSVLRLADMDSIPNIKSKEIENEINIVLNSFSSINSKINNLIKQQALEEELVEFNN